MISTQKVQKILLITAIVAIITYFLHVWVGTYLYEGYNPLSQAISDLTADDSPVKTITRTLSSIYGLLSTIVVLGFIYYREIFNHKISRLGLIFFSIMMIVSATGYALFPLSASGYAGSFQDVMHMIVTIIVVSFTIISLILLAIGFKNKTYRIITIASFVVLMTSSMLMSVVSPNYFGVMERISVYTVVIYFGFLSIVVLYNKSVT
jgi:hypothetical membrane protein